MDSGAGGTGGGAGGSGGGKTRRKRCHQRSSRPYRQGRQRPQSVLSRVTESLKNIVPRCLQSYFSRDEGVCTCSTARRQAPQQLENREDGHLLNADEESSKVHDGRLTPVRTVSNTEDIGASKNTSAPHPHFMKTECHSFSQNMASRKRAQKFLSFKCFSQPRDRSGIITTIGHWDKKQKTGDGRNMQLGHNRDQQKSDVCYRDFSISAANGLPSGEGRGNGKFNHERMGFVATKPPQKAIGFTFSQPVGKKPELSGSRSVGEPVTSGSDRAASKNTSVPPLWSIETDRYDTPTLFQHTASSKKPACDVLAFVKYSLSIGISLQLKTKKLGDSLFYPGKTRYGGAAAVVRHTGVHKRPHKAPVRRQMRTKQLHTQSCGVMSLTARRILQSLEASTPSLTGYEKAVKPGRNRELESMSAANCLPSGEGSEDDKFNRERTSFVTTKPPEEEHCFNFSSPVMTSPSLINPAQSLTNRVQMMSSNNTGKLISGFSSPTVQSTQADVGFTLSVPVVKTPELSSCNSSSEPLTSSSGFTSWKKDSLAAQPTTTGPVVCTRPAISSFSSSEMALSESLKSRSSWQCDSCQLVNKVTDNQCITCHSTKLPPITTAKQTVIGAPTKRGKTTLHASGTGFQDKFKPAVGTWDCDTCLVQNKLEAIKCVACETPIPGTGVKGVFRLPVGSERTVAVAASSSSCPVTSVALQCGKKLKRPVGSWQCPLCYNFNSAEDKKCVTCMGEKPDQSSSDAVFSLLNISSISILPAPSAPESTFGSFTPSSGAPMAASVCRQASSGSSWAFHNSQGLRTCQPFTFSPETKPATTSSMGTAVTPCVSGSGVLRNNNARSGICFGATTMPRAAAFGLKQSPTFGQSQGACRPNPPGLGTLSSSAAFFTPGSQPETPTLGTVSRGIEPPVFEKPPVESALGSETASNSREQDLESSLKDRQLFI